MEDAKKTKAQLIKELEELRKQNVEFEAEGTERKKAEEALRLTQFANDQLFCSCLLDGA